MSRSAKPSPLSMDRLGMMASIGCAVHCLLTPVVLSLSAVYAHMLPTEEHTHRFLAVVVSAIGAIALVRGYRKHRSARPLLLMGVGLGFIIGGACFGDQLPSHAMEVCITLCGSCCMVAAHRINHTFCSRCERCC